MWKYRNVFLLWFVKYVFYLSLVDNIFFDEYGWFGGDGEIFVCFMDVVRVIWLVYELVFLFDFLVIILRMMRGILCDK